MPIEHYPYDVESDVFKRWLDTITQAIVTLQTQMEHLRAWYLYADESHDSTDPQIFVADTPQKLANDGGTGDQDHGLGHLVYDTDTQILSAEEEGHLHLIELDFTADNGSPALRYIVEGRGATSGVVLGSHTLNFTKGGNTEHTVNTITALPFNQIAMDEGGIEIWVTCDSNVDIWGTKYMITHIGG